MKIGVDLDGVVFDSEKEFRVLSELYDMLELKQNSKIDNREMLFEKRFAWSKERSDEFFEKIIDEVVEKSNVMPGAKLVLQMLKNEGNELVVITARGIENPEIIEVSNKAIKKNGLDLFDKYIYRAIDKAEVCKEENIDVMIDDSTDNCKKVSSIGVKTMYFKGAESFELPESKCLKTVYNWGEVYRELGKSEIK